MRLSLIFGICATQKAGIGTTTIDCASSGERDNMQARIDAKLEAKAAAGPTAREGVGAGMSDAIPTLPLH